MSEIHPYLRYLAAWDRDETDFHAQLDRLANRPVRFSGVPRPCDTQEECLSAFIADPMAAVTESPDGTLLLPGNPHEVLHQLLEERYPVPRPRWGQRMRREATRPPRRDDRRGGLRWPDEPRVDQYRRDLYLGLVDESERGEPRSARRAFLEANPWPDALHFALCVTYDVADARGLSLISAVAEEDLAHGARPAFFVRPQLLDNEVLDSVREMGAEIGLLGDELHRLRPSSLRKRLTALAAALERHRTVGFRGHPWALTPEQRSIVAEHFAYSCSVPDTFPTRTLNRGCGVTVPHWRGGLLELPVTVGPRDRWIELGYQGLDLLDLERDKTMAIRERSGVAVFSLRLATRRRRDRVRRDLLGAILAEVSDLGDVWYAPPSEVADHWARAAR